MNFLTEPLADSSLTLAPHGAEFARYALAFLWQSTLLFLAVGIVCRFLRNRPARVRCLVWLSALLIAPTLPVLSNGLAAIGAPQTSIINLRPMPDMPGIAKPLPMANIPKPPVQPSEQQTEISQEPEAKPLSTPASTATTTEKAIPPVKSSAPLPATSASTQTTAKQPMSLWGLGLAVYLIGLILLIGWIIMGRLRLAQWTARSTAACHPVLNRAFSDARLRLDMKKCIPVLLSPDADAPVTLGIIRPRVLIPESLADELSQDEADAIALHELSHLRRRDPLSLLFTCLMRAVFYFHPLVWIVSHHISDLAEHAADEMVLEHQGTPLPYAKMITRLAEGLPLHAPCCEMAAGLLLGRKSFLGRVESILSGRQTAALTRRGTLVLILLIAFVLVGVLALPLGEKANRSALYEKAKSSGRDLRVKIGPNTFNVQAVIRNGPDGELHFENGKGEGVDLRYIMMPDDPLIKNADWMDMVKIDLALDSDASDTSQLYDIIETRVFDHSTGQPIFDGPYAPPYGVIPGNDNTIRLWSIGQKFPDKIDLWFRVASHENSGSLRIIKPVVGASTSLNNQDFTIEDVMDGEPRPGSLREKPGEWKIEPSTKSIFSTFRVKVEGTPQSNERWQICAVSKNGRKAIGNIMHDNVTFGMRLEDILHLELRPSAEKTTFFFEGVELPDIGMRTFGKPPVLRFEINGQEKTLTSDAWHPILVRGRMLKSRNSNISAVAYGNGEAGIFQPNDKTSSLKPEKDTIFVLNLNGGKFNEQNFNNIHSKNIYHETVSSEIAVSAFSDIVAAVAINISAPLEEVQTLEIGLVNPRFDPGDRWVSPDGRMRYVGVRVGGRDQVIAPDGSIAMELPGYVLGRPVWKAEQIRRDFIFELADDSTDLELFGPVGYGYIGYGYNEKRYSFTIPQPFKPYRPVMEKNGKYYLQISHVFEKKVIKYPKHKTLLGLFLRYRSDRPLPADHVFTGPFIKGTVYDDKNKNGATFKIKEIKPWDKYTSTYRFQVDTNKAYAPVAQIVFHDASGQRYEKRYSGGRYPLDSSSLEYELQVAPEVFSQFTHATINQDVAEWELTDIPIVFEDMTEPEYSPDLDRIAERLNLGHTSPDILSSRKFSTEESVKIIDVIRSGTFFYDMAQKMRYDLRPSGFKKLPEEDRQRIHKAALDWLKCDLSRPYGLEVGVAGQWPEFIDAALDSIEKNDFLSNRCARIIQDMSGALTDEHFRRIERIPSNDRSAINGITWNYTLNRAREKKEARRVKWTFMQSDPPSFWIGAVKGSPSARQLTDEFGYTDLIGARAKAIGAGNQFSDRDIDDEMVKQVYHKALNTSDPLVIGDLTDEAIKVLPREEVTALLMNYLKNCKEEWDKYNVPQISNPLPRSIIRAVKQLNDLNNTNIAFLGGVGQEMAYTYDFFNINYIINEAEVWYRTGQDPSDLPAGWSPGEKDLRVVWYDKNNPDKSQILVWPWNWQKQNQKGYACIYSDPLYLMFILQDAIPADDKFQFNFIKGAFYYGSKSDKPVFEWKDIPKKAIDWVHEDYELINTNDTIDINVQVWIEKAGAVESVIADTPVFQKYKDEYLKPGGLEKPMPAIIESDRATEE